MPDHVPDENVVSLELAMCVQVSFDQLEIFGGVRDQKIGITGLGPAGLIAAQMANAYGAREIVAFDPLPARRAQATDIATTLPPRRGRLRARPLRRRAPGPLDRLYGTQKRDPIPDGSHRIGR